MSEPVDYSVALATVNELHDAMAGLGRAIVVDLKDGKLSIPEDLQLGMKGMALAMSFISFIKENTPDERNMVLYVLEQGHFTMDKTS